MIGGAEISKKHSGFIVNINNATCKDIQQLISVIKSKIKKQYNVDLEEEIEYVPY